MIEVHEGDNATAWSTILKRGGVPVNLTGATVYFKMRERSESVLKIEETEATITDAENGAVQYEPRLDGSDTNTPGFYYARWRVEFASGRQDTYPTVMPDFVWVIGALV